MKVIRTDSELFFINGGSIFIDSEAAGTRWSIVWWPTEGVTRPIIECRDEAHAAELFEFIGFGLARDEVVNLRGKGK
jgi:hypothetical protein